MSQLPDDVLVDHLLNSGALERLMRELTMTFIRMSAVVEGSEQTDFMVNLFPEKTEVIRFPGNPISK
jgi:hypothetical protein